MDIKLLSFGKWHISKETSLINIDSKLFNYSCLGCYDLLNISTIENRGISVYSSMYDSIEGCKNKLTATSSWYIERQIVIFRDSPSCEAKFDDSQQMFVTLINTHHSCDESNSISFEREICELFKKYNYANNYTLYYTLDCANFVLVVHGIKVSEYFKIIHEINFGNKFSRFINDTTTLYCISTDFVKSLENRQPAATDAPSFRINCNIGINDANVINELYDDRVISKSNPQISGITLGKYDCSASFDLSNDEQIAYVICLFDNFWSSKKITSFEATLGEIEQFNEFTCLKKGDFLRPLVENINDLFCKYCRTCKTTNDNEKGKIINVMTIREISNSLISIIRDGFAISFLPCVYKPFCDFMQYSIDFFGQTYDSESFKKYEDMCMSFFDKIKRLMFSTIHNTHHSSYVVTSNSFYFDVASRLLAFYSIYVNETAESLGANKYSFLFTPDINESIYLEKLFSESFSKNIVSIIISEKSFYEPVSLLDLLNHEIGHFVGEALRLRPKRKECFLKLAIYSLLLLSMPKELTSIINDIVDCAFDVISQRDEFSVGKDNYSKDLYGIIKNIPLLLSGKEYTEDFRIAIENVAKDREKYILLLENYCSYIGITKAKNTTQTSEDIRRISSWLAEHIQNGITLINTFPDTYNEYHEQMLMYIYVLREGFSDLLMKCLSDVKNQDYRNYLSLEEEPEDHLLSGNELRYTAVNLANDDRLSCCNDYVLTLIVSYLSLCKSNFKKGNYSFSFSKDDIRIIKEFTNAKDVYESVDRVINKYILKLCCK